MNKNFNTETVQKAINEMAAPKVIFGKYKSAFLKDQEFCLDLVNAPIKIFDHVISIDITPENLTNYFELKTVHNFFYTYKLIILDP
jgi:RAB protein geranylgeranyltransferase component A